MNTEDFVEKAEKINGILARMDAQLATIQTMLTELKESGEQSSEIYRKTRKELEERLPTIVRSPSCNC